MQKHFPSAEKDQNAAAAPIAFKASALAYSYLPQAPRRKSLVMKDIRMARKRINVVFQWDFGLSKGTKEASF